MKVFTRGNKIVLKKVTDEKEIEETIASIGKCIERLKYNCEDRHLDEFPVDVVHRIVEHGNKLSKLGKDAEVDSMYLEHVIQHKEALGYFKERCESFNEQCNVYDAKKMIFTEFANELEDLIQNIKK